VFVVASVLKFMVFICSDDKCCLFASYLKLVFICLVGDSHRVCIFSLSSYYASYIAAFPLSLCNTEIENYVSSCNTRVLSDLTLLIESYVTKRLVFFRSYNLKLWIDTANNCFRAFEALIFLMH